MKVVALVVIFLLIWRWACSSPMPCEPCPTGHCNHMQPDESTNDIARSKRGFGLSNITNTLRNAANAIRPNKRHFLSKREDTNLENRSSEQSTVFNSQKILNESDFQNRMFLKDMNNKTLQMTDDFAVDSNKDVVVQNSTFDKFPSLQNYSQENSKEKTYDVPTKVKRSATMRRSTTTNLPIRIERQTSVSENDTLKAQNLTLSARNSSKVKREKTRNDTQTQTTILPKTQANLMNVPQRNQNITTNKRQTSTTTSLPIRVERQTSVSENDTLKAQNLTLSARNSSKVKREKARNDTQTQTTILPKTQTNLMNVPQRNQNITTNKRQTSTTTSLPIRVERQTSVSENDTLKAQNLTLSDRNSSKVKQEKARNDTQTQTTILPKTQAILMNVPQSNQNITTNKRHTSDNQINSKNFRSKFRRQISDTTNHTQGAQDTTSTTGVNRQGFYDYQNDTQETQNTTKIRRQTSHHQHHTNKPQNATKVTRQISDDNQNNSQAAQNVTKVKRQSLDSKNMTENAQEETSVKRNNIKVSVIAENTTKVKRELSGNNNVTLSPQNATDIEQIRNKYKRETSDAKNYTEMAQNVTKAKRQSSNYENITENAQEATKVKGNDVNYSLRAQNTTEVQSKVSGNEVTLSPQSATVSEQIKNKRQTSDSNNYTEIAQNITRTGRMTSNVINMFEESQVNHNNITKRQTADVNSNTRLALNMTAAKNQTSTTENRAKRAIDTVNPTNLDVKNATQGAQNITNVKRQTSTYENNTNVTENTTIVRSFQNTDANSESKIINERQNFDTKNNINEDNTTAINMNSQNEMVAQTIVKLRIQRSALENNTNETQKSTRNRRDTPVSIKALDGIDVSRKKRKGLILFISILKRNGTLEVSDFKNRTSKNFHFFKNGNGNKIKRQASNQSINELPFDSHQNYEKSYIKKEKNPVVFPIKETNVKLQEIASDVDNITIQIKSFRDSEIKGRGREKRENSKEDGSNQTSSKVDEATEINENNQVIVNTTRKRKNANNRKNITIQIHKYISDEMGKTKRNSENITSDTNSTHTKLWKSSVSVAKVNTTSNATNIKSAATKSNTKKKSRNTCHLRQQTRATDNNIQQESKIRERRQQLKSESKRKPSDNIDAHKTVNRTKEHSKHHQVKRQTQISIATLGLRRPLRQLDKSQNNVTNNYTNQDEVAKRDKRNEGLKARRPILKSETNNTEDDAKSIRETRASDCTGDLKSTEEAQKFHHARVTRDSVADQKISLNDSDHQNHTLMNQNVRNSGSDNDSTTSKNASVVEKSINQSNQRRRVRYANADQTHIMKVSPKVLQGAKNESSHNLATSEQTKNVSRHRRLALLENQEDLNELEENSVLSGEESDTRNHGLTKFVPVPLLVSFSATNGTDENSMKFYEVSNVDTKSLVEKNTDTVSINGYYRYTLDDSKDDDEKKLEENEARVVFINGINNSSKKLVLNDMSGEEFEEKEIGFSVEKSSLTSERIRCACASYWNDPAKQEKNGSYDETIWNISPGKSNLDKKLMCIKICSEIYNVDVRTKQEIYCAHVKAFEEKLKEMFPPREQDPPETFVFCQVFMTENETLQFILSWLNVIFLDVVVCLTGLGIVCLYLICFVSWKKRDGLPVYTASTFTAK